MRIAVLGAGSIGCLIAAKLVEAGHDVLVHARGEHGAVLALSGLNVSGVWDFQILPNQWTVSLDEAGIHPSLEKSFDQSIITCKAKDTEKLAEIAAQITDGPALIWWPFGILGFASLPRSDARLWPDRSSLGNSALSAPLVMILLGMGFTLLGLKLTPDLVPLDSVPLSLELPLLIHLIGLSMEGEIAMLLKTSWAHPLTRAGMTLTFIGWISLLPVPTFPGGRILIARMGIPEARSGSTQVMLLMVVLLFALCI